MSLSARREATRTPRRSYLLAVSTCGPGARTLSSKQRYFLQSEPLVGGDVFVAGGGNAGRLFVPVTGSPNHAASSVIVVYEF